MKRVSLALWLSTITLPLLAATNTEQETIYGFIPASSSRHEAGSTRTEARQSVHDFRSATMKKILVGVYGANGHQIHGALADHPHGELDAKDARNGIINPRHWHLALVDQIF